MTMLKHISKRILLSVLTILIILAVSYLLLRLSPGDPARSSFLGEIQLPPPAFPQKKVSQTGIDQ